MRMRYHAVLFDLDGTLIDSSAIWDKATRKAVQESGITFSEEDFMRLAGVLINDLMHQKGYNEESIQRVRAARDTYMKQGIAEGVQWVEGARALVENAKTDAATGIVTSVHERIFEHFDTVLSLTTLVDTVVLADHISPHLKPKPDGLLLACTQLDVHPKNAVYIGDQECDLLAAHSAGMDFILLKGPRTPADLHHTKIASSPAEVLAWL